MRASHTPRPRGGQSSSAGHHGGLSAPDAWPLMSALCRHLLTLGQPQPCEATCGCRAPQLCCRPGISGRGRAASPAWQPQRDFRAPSVAVSAWQDGDGGREGSGFGGPVSPLGAASPLPSGAQRGTFWPRREEQAPSHMAPLQSWGSAQGAILWPAVCPAGKDRLRENEQRGGQVRERR